MCNPVASHKGSALRQEENNRDAVEGKGYRSSYSVQLFSMPKGLLKQQSLGNRKNFKYYWTPNFCPRMKAGETCCASYMSTGPWTPTIDLNSLLICWLCRGLCKKLAWAEETSLLNKGNTSLWIDFCVIQFALSMTVTFVNGSVNLKASLHFVVNFSLTSWLPDWWPSFSELLKPFSQVMEMNDFLNGESQSKHWIETSGKADSINL